MFVELNELVVDKNQEMHWRETARWIKFEEDVEEDTARWGKPHVASLSFRSLLELRKTIAHGESEVALCCRHRTCMLPWHKFCWTAPIAVWLLTEDMPAVSVQAPCWMWETDHPTVCFPGYCNSPRMSEVTPCSALLSSGTWHCHTQLYQQVLDP